MTTTEENKALFRRTYEELLGPGSISPGPSHCPYSAECVEGVFSEVRQESFGDHPFGGGPCILPAAMVLRDEGRALEHP